MNLDDNEKKLLKLLLQKEIESFRKEGKTIVVDDNPNFMALEESYDAFLEKLLNKI